MIEKYDRFKKKRGDEIIEFIGLTTCNDYVFKVICPRVGTRKGDIVIYSPTVFKISGFEKIPRSAYTHPLLSEIGAELKNNPVFLEDLIKFCVLINNQATQEDKNRVYKLVKKHVPPEWFMTLETIADMHSEGDNEYY
jgi:hypothetical protein